MLNKNKKKEIDSELSVASSVSTDKKKKNMKVLKKVFYILSLVIIVLSIIRVPYIGQFFDAVFFSFIFGWAKYFLYGYCIFYLMVKITDCKKKPLHSKRYFFFSLIITAFISMLLGGVEILVYAGKYNVSDYVNLIWRDQIWNMDNKWYFGSSQYIDGGFIGAILSSISGVFIVILAIIAVIATYLIFFPNQRRKLLEKLLVKASKKYNVPALNQFNLNKSENNNEKYKLISSNKQKNFSLKDSYIKNDINAKSIRIGLEKYLDDHGINFSDIQVDEDDSLLTLKFTIDEAQAKKFESIKGDIATVFKKTQYKLTWIDSTVLIKVDKYSKQVSSVLSTYMSNFASNDYDFTLCLSDNNQPIILNLLINNIIGISADSCSEFIYSYINAIIAYLSVNYRKDRLEIACVSPIPVKENILTSQNTIKGKIEDYTNLKKFFSYLIDDIKVQDKLLQQHQVKTIHELNQLGVIDKYFKFRVIILDNVNLIADKDPRLFEAILNIMKHAKRYNLAFVLVDNSKSGTTFKTVPYNMILSLDTKNVDREQLLTTSNSQVKLYVPNKKEKYLVRIPRVNENELKIISDKLASLFNQYNE